MDKKEYIEESDKIESHLDQDSNSYEKLQYTFVWLKSRMPELHNDIVKNFQQIEASVYAHRQEQDAKDEQDVDNSRF